MSNAKAPQGAFFRFQLLIRFFSHFQIAAAVKSNPSLKAVSIWVTCPFVTGTYRHSPYNPYSVDTKYQPQQGCTHPLIQLRRSNPDRCCLVRRVIYRIGSRTVIFIAPDAVDAYSSLRLYTATPCGITVLPTGS